jgi:hypothetical protein
MRIIKTGGDVGKRCNIDNLSIVEKRYGCDDYPCFDPCDPEPTVPVFNTQTGQLRCGPPPDVVFETGRLTPGLIGPRFIQDINGNWITKDFLDPSEAPPDYDPLSGGITNVFDAVVAENLFYWSYLTPTGGTASVTPTGPYHLETNTSRYLGFEVWLNRPTDIVETSWTITITLPLQYSFTITIPMNSVGLGFGGFAVVKCPLPSPTNSPALPSYYAQFDDYFANPDISSFGAWNIQWGGLTSASNQPMWFGVLGPWLGAYSA